MKTSKTRGQPTYEIIVAPNDNGGFYARVPDFPTIFTGGKTAVEAMTHAEEAVALMIEEYRERGLPAPEPKSRFSGHFNVRVPRELHRELARRADEEGVSLNALVLTLLARSSAGATVAAGGRPRKRAG